MKTIITVTGIRPDFIRMSAIFKKLDSNFNHILIHTGQHYDQMLSDIFFTELQIRKPNYNLTIGGKNKEHFHQTGELSTKLIELIRKENLNPDMIMFLGDSNSVASAVSLKKEGYKIGHIEAGMRSYDKRMLEEINRTVCDHCSDIHFVYHDDYKTQLIKEGLPQNNIHVVGNTIVEVFNEIKPQLNNLNKNKHIVLDVHRPENFKYEERLNNIVKYAEICSKRYNLPVYMLKFSRTFDYINKYKTELNSITPIDLMSYKNYCQLQQESLFIISDSGTAQEEPALMGVPVIVPRDFTERPQSIRYNCSFMLNVNNLNNHTNSFAWLENNPQIDTTWLGKGNTSELIIETIKTYLDRKTFI
jgi:UDP-N-acetylglucosamine 2-epimerase